MNFVTKHFIRQTGIAVALSLLAVTGVSAQTAPSGAKPAAKKKVAPVDKPALEARAVDLLKATSARLAAAKAMSFTATVSYEHPSRLGPPLVFTSRYDVVMQRPEKLRVINLGDGPASEFYLDGKTMVAFAPAETLFLSDVVEELDAARAAGMRTVLLARDGDGCPADPGHPCATSFDAIDPSAF